MSLLLLWALSSDFSGPECDEDIILDRRDFLKYAAAGGILLSNKSLHVQFQSAKKPNILWLIAEDFSPDLSCYGTPAVKTPNIDNLAGQGARFTNAFTPSPVCSASRSGFMTGMYQTAIGAHHHRSHRGDGYIIGPGVKVITDYFRQAGYFTSNCKDGNWTQSGKTDFNFTWSKPFDGTDWRQRAPDQPFYAQVNFKQTHRGFVNDPDNPIDPDTIELPPYYPDHPITRRDWADYLESTQILDGKVGQVLKRLEDDGLADNTIVFFFGDHGRCHVRGKQFLYDGGIRIPLIIRWPGRIRRATVVDDLVSAIDFGPTCLEAIGFTPPGYMQGRIFLGSGAKKRDYIFAARDRCDGTYDRIRCVRNKRYKYIRNFFPSRPYTALYGNYSPARPYTAFNAYKWKQYPVLTVLWALHNSGRLTPQQELFMASSRPAEELFDLQNDPHEVNNLAGNAQYQTIQNQLSNSLDDWVIETQDQGEIIEDTQVTTKELENMESVHISTMASRGFAPDVTPEQYLEYWKGKFGLA